MNTVNALGLACPTPVIMAKKEIEEHPGEAVTVLVDNEVARHNLEKLAASLGMSAAASGQEPNIAVLIVPPDSDEAVRAGQTECELMPASAMSDDYVVFFGKDIVGEGDRELGTNLVRMFFYSLTETDKLPTAIMFMNAGVKLPTLDDQVVEHLKVLASRGVRILSCGACLDFYKLKDQLKVGEVSNMYEIAQTIINSPKEVTL